MEADQHSPFSSSSKWNKPRGLNQRIKLSIILPSGPQNRQCGSNNENSEDTSGNFAIILSQSLHHKECLDVLVIMLRNVYASARIKQKQRPLSHFYRFFQLSFEHHNVSAPEFYLIERERTVPTTASGACIRWQCTR